MRITARIWEMKTKSKKFVMYMKEKNQKNLEIGYICK